MTHEVLLLDACIYSKYDFAVRMFSEHPNKTESKCSNLPASNHPLKPIDATT